MICTYLNGVLNNEFASWEKVGNQIKKGLLSISFDGLNLPDVFPISTQIEKLTDEKVFVSYNDKNLDPKLIPSETEKSYFILLATLALNKDEKVVFVKSEGGQVLEWNHNTVARHFDLILSFKQSIADSKVTVYIANAASQVRYIEFKRSGDNLSFNEEDYQKMDNIRTDKPLVIVPYRPFIPSELILVHAKNATKAMECIKGDRYKFVTYNNIKELRKAAEILKAEGYTVVTHFFDAAGKEQLTKEQSFFARVLAEYFKFIHLSYNNRRTTSRYVFSGKSTIPNRKKPGRKPVKQQKATNNTPNKKFKQLSKGTRK